MIQLRSDQHKIARMQLNGGKGDHLTINTLLCSRRLNGNWRRLSHVALDAREVGLVGWRAGCICSGWLRSCSNIPTCSFWACLCRLWRSLRSDGDALGLVDRRSKTRPLGRLRRRALHCWSDYHDVRSAQHPDGLVFQKLLAENRRRKL